MWRRCAEQRAPRSREEPHPGGPRHPAAVEGAEALARPAALHSGSRRRGRGINADEGNLRGRRCGRRRALRRSAYGRHEPIGALLARYGARPKVQSGGRQRALAGSRPGLRHPLCTPCAAGGARRTRAGGRAGLVRFSVFAWDALRCPGATGPDFRTVLSGSYNRHAPASTLPYLPARLPCRHSRPASPVGAGAGWCRTVAPSATARRPRCAACPRSLFLRHCCSLRAATRFPPFDARRA